MTKGPWKAIWTEPPLVPYAGWWIKTDDDMEFPIAFITQTIGGISSPQEANARAIALLPDLIEAAREVLQVWDDFRQIYGKDSWEKTQWRKLRSVLSKLEVTP